jgi:hypothetical protein
MRLSVEGLLYLAVGVCSVMMIVSIIAYLCAISLVISRTGAVVDWAEERELSWGERARAQIAGSAGSSSPMNLDRYASSYSALRWGRLDPSASFCC